jgi:metal-responsive CopG/Arc/MetJ family transcriptional regulator
MSVLVSLPDELVAQIDGAGADRTTFVTEAVRRLLRDSPQEPATSEIDRINELADELNEEARDVLEYQVFS